MDPTNPAHVVADQSAVFDWLAAPSTHGVATRRIDTHGAMVVLAGDKAFKAKRAVRFPFMDYSTLERRKAACEAEVAVNRDAAPGLYLGTVPITREPSGAFALGGAGTPVEWVVAMRRFDEAATLDVLAERGPFEPALVAELARTVLASHAAAPLRPAEPAIASLHAYIAQNREAFAESPDLFPVDRAESLCGASESLLSRVEPLLLARGAEGRVRRCHGDLHLRNIALIDGHPTLFDAIEFDDAIATGDVLYDLAFLLMDLMFRGHETEANTVLNRYLWTSDPSDLDGLAALPLFLSLRAAIRAKVVAAGLGALSGGEREAAAAVAARYFAWAQRALDPRPARLVAVGGFSGTGKSTLAAALAPMIGRPPGAVHLRSDVERKRMFGVAETQRLPASAYSPRDGERVYAILCRKAKQALAAGASVIVDAVHARPEERLAVERLAREAGGAFTGIWLSTSAPRRIERVEARKDDASDADAAVVAAQSMADPGPIAWAKVDASGSPEQVLAAVARAVGVDTEP